jgi:hypothetical protein
MTNNQQHFSRVTENEPINVLPVGVVSDEFISTLESTMKDYPTTNKRKRTFQNESSIKENDERLNRVNFFFKDIHTSMTYVDIFASIATMYPFIQLNAIEKSTKIQYLCVAGNVLVYINHMSKLRVLDTSKSTNEKLISIHLCFAKKVNFKHKFVNHIFPGKYSKLMYFLSKSLLE